MENGMVGNTIGFPIFQHSIIPIFQSSSLRPPGSLRMVVLFSFLKKNLSFSGSPAKEDKKMNKEEAENAEILF